MRTRREVVDSFHLAFEGHVLDVWVHNAHMVEVHGDMLTGEACPCGCGRPLSRSVYIYFEYDEVTNMFTPLTGGDDNPPIASGLTEAVNAWAEKNQLTLKMVDADKTNNELASFEYNLMMLEQNVQGIHSDMQELIDAFRKRTGQEA